MLLIEGLSRAGNLCLERCVLSSAMDEGCACSRTRVVTVVVDRPDGSTLGAVRIRGKKVIGVAFWRQVLMWM